MFFLAAQAAHTASRHARKNQVCILTSSGKGSSYVLSQNKAWPKLFLMFSVINNDSFLDVFKSVVKFFKPLLLYLIVLFL